MAARNAFSIVTGARETSPAFSGVTGQIDHVGWGGDGFGATTKSGQRVDEGSALRVSAIWIATSVLADEIASIAMRILERDDENRQPLRPESLRSLWSDAPNPAQDHFGIEATQALSVVLYGGAFTMLGWTRGGDLDVRWPQNPDPAVTKLEYIGGDPAAGLQLTVRDRGELLNRVGERPEFWFCPLYQLPGQLQPVSPVRMAAELAGLSLSYQETAARLMGRGLQPAALLMADEYVPDDQAEPLARRLERLHGGSGKAGGVAVVGAPGLKLQHFTMSMADAQFIAQNEFAFKMLLAFWRVPATVAGMVDQPSTWGTGVAEFSRGLERFTLRPLVQRLQGADQKYIADWARGFTPGTLQIRRIFDSLLSASPKDRAEIQSRRLASGVTSVERVLAQEDEPPFGEDETVYSQLAMATDEERQMKLLAARAEAYSALIRAGAEPEAAAATTGFDPAQLTHTGRPPVTTVEPAGEEQGEE